jgi:hypothetical protein
MTYITLEIRFNYGIQVLYPACDISKTFARIAGTKTLTVETVKLIQSLGYDVKQTICGVALS